MLTYMRQKNIIFLYCHWLVYVTFFLTGLAASFGSIEVSELDWGNEDHIKAVDPPFDYIIGTDIVSHFGTASFRLRLLIKQANMRL